MADGPVLVTGAAGMLGLAVIDALAVRSPGLRTPTTVVVRDRSSAGRLPGDLRVEILDLTDLAGAADLVPDGGTVVNAAGITKHRAWDPDEARRINSELPHALAEACDRRSSRLIHVSTDCVFDAGHGPAAETDRPDARDEYGRTKADGEVDRAPHLTVRTSFIGRDPWTHRGLLEWLLAQHGPVPGYRNARWNGGSASAVAGLIVALIERPEVHGMLHLAGETVDKATLLTLLADAFRLPEVTVKPVDEPRIDRTLEHPRADALGLQFPAIRAMVAGLP